MWYLRFVLTWASEFVYIFPVRHEVQNSHSNTWMKMFSWCYYTAQYTANNKHSLYLCWDRARWEAWMMEN